ncbi:hypothetical protein BY458DRAFT_532120 [Sporodiniella umbellata]|nr:hypothetical protein BY458DRAFT_532120 [Sporodiniella umbellata]
MHSRSHREPERHSRNSNKRSHESQSSRETIEPISEDDYFEKATEFRLWLKEHKDLYFDELSSKDARYYFKKFTKKWNRNELKSKYYKGLNPSHLESSDSTRYKWSFAKNLDKMEMDTIRDSVDSMTSRNSGDDKLRESGKRRNVGPALPDRVDREEQYERQVLERKHEAKRNRSRREAMLDEVAPKQEGREAMLLKKKALNAYHKRERSPDVELSEADLMGGDDFQSTLAAEKRRIQARESRQAERREQRLAPIMSKRKRYNGDVQAHG